MKTLSIAFVFLMAGACALAPTAKPGASVYERYAELKKDPAFNAKLAEPAQRIHDLDWMIGEWRAEAVVFATPSTPEWRNQSEATFQLVGEAMIASDDLSTVLTWNPFIQ